MKLKILTFNWHAPYLCMLAQLPHDFLVVEPEISPGKFKLWEEGMRPQPANVTRMSPDAAAVALGSNKVDLAIAHNIKDLVWLHPWNGAKILVFHNRLSTEIALGQNRVNRGDYLAQIAPLLEGVTRVFISASKKADWGYDGSIIPPGIDLDAFNGYTGERSLGLRVGNHFLERNLMLGYDASEKIAAGFPVKTLGLNPSLPASRPTRDFADLLDHYRQCRFYLHTTVHPYEDGYNLALLEAMATGMPVVSLENPSSPVKDGWNGYISRDIAPLRESAARLLADQALARRLGGNARETVRQQFSQKTFLDAWSQTIEGAKTGGSFTPIIERTEKANSMNILMDYVSYPATTACYLEKALRKFCRVVTCGGTITESTLKRWDLMAIKQRVTPQDLPREPGAPLAQTLEKLPPGFIPDLYLWVETGLGGPPPDLAESPLPKACYLIDSHLNFETHRQIALNFDWVFVAQKAFVEPLKAAGCPAVFWLPLGCDGDIHNPGQTGKVCDVGFAGTVSPAHRRRAHLLAQIGEYFHLRAERRFLEDMAQLYAQSKIVFNNAIAGDLNMRVFEAMASGSLLLTDPVPESGLDELFEAGRHFVYYEDENLVQTVRYYLDRPEERERIAREGQRHVLAHHTYLHRARALIATVRESLPVKPFAPARQESSEKLNGHGSPAREEPAPAMAAPDAYYRNVRRDVLPLIPDDAMVVLEVGCGAGGTGRELKKTRGRFVAGIELDAVAARAAREVLDDVLEGDIEKIDLPYRPGSFDCLLLADVIEHLIDPLAALKKLKPMLKPGGTVVASIPNVQFFGLLHHLVEGNWTYQAEGILDRTHLRFFTFREIEKLFEEAGFALTRIEENLDPQYEATVKNGRGSLKVGRLTLNDMTPEELRRFFVFQYRIAARLKAPSVSPATREEASIHRTDIEEKKVADRERLKVAPPAPPYAREEAFVRPTDIKDQNIADRKRLKVAPPASPSKREEGYVRPADLKEKKIADGERLEAEGHVEEAARLYGQIRRIFPECTHTRFLEARALEKTGETRRALETLEEAHRSQPDDIEVLLALGRLRLVAGLADGALEVLFHALGVAPEEARIFMGLGQVFDCKKFPAEACYCYLKALALDAGNRLAQERVLTLIKHRPPGALALIDRLLAEHPGHAGLLLAQAASRSPEAQPAGHSSRLDGTSSNRRTIGPVTVRVPQKIINS